MSARAIAGTTPLRAMMPQFLRASLHARIFTGIAIMLLPLLGLAMGTFLGIHSVSTRFKEVVEEVHGKMQLVVSLQVAVLQAEMPANDYLIHGEGAERDKFVPLNDRVERNFKRLEAAPLNFAEESMLRSSAREEWRQAQSISEILLTLPRPVGNAAAASEMKRLDEHVDRAVDLLGQIYARASKDIEREFAEAGATGRVMLWLAFGIFGVGFTIAASVGAALARSILARVKALSEGAQAFSKGDLSRRVPVIEPDELGQLAATFNAMAQRLEESRAALEGKASKLKALNQIAVAINTSSLSLRDVLDEIMRQGVHLIGAKASCIAFYDEATRRFVNWVNHGLSEHFVRHMDFRPEGLGDEAFTHRSYILSNDRPETKHKLSRLAREEGLRSFVCLPLTSRDCRLGVIYFYRADRDTFAPAEVELLSILASLAAQAIENARLYAQAQEQARNDALTGLFNRREFQRLLDREIERAGRYGRPLALLMLDIDHFKRINDSHGHPAGDEVLRAFAGLIRSALRSEDQPARYGGEEFAVILPEITSAHARVVAERIRSAIAVKPFVLSTGTTLDVTVSIGVAAYSNDADTAPALIAAADRALYSAKNGGRNRVCESSAGPHKERRQ